MGHKKTNIWIIIAALLLTFILSTLVDINTVAGSFKVEIRDSDNNLVPSTTIPEKFSVDLPKNAVVYKQFSVSSQTPGKAMFFDITNRWLEISEVAPTAIQLYQWNSSGTNWSLAPIELVSEYAVTTLYSTEKTSSQPYMIIGIKKTAPANGELQLWHKSLIIAIIIIILLFIAHYKPKANQNKKKILTDTMASLDAYVKKSLVEGHGEEEIRSALVASGWDEKAIDEAIKRLRYF